MWVYLIISFGNFIPNKNNPEFRNNEREVANIQTPYIEPTRVEPSYIPKDMIPTIPKFENSAW